MQWKHPSSASQKKIQDTGFHWESLADHLLGCQWPCIGALPEKGQTVTSARYSDMLVNKLKPVIQPK